MHNGNAPRHQGFINQREEMTMSQFAKQALIAKHAYVAALLAGAAAIAGAQTTSAPNTSTAPMMGQSGAPGMMHPGGRHDPAKMQAAVAKRLADLKGKLKLTADQEGSWTTFSAAMTPPAMMGKGMQGNDRADFEKLSTPERIEKMRAMREQRHATMTTEMGKREDAAKAFYATLSAEQKKTFDAETLRVMRGMRGMHGGMQDGHENHHSKG